MKPREEWVSHRRSNVQHILPIGYRSGKLTVKKFLGTNRHKKYLYLCRCDCGGKSRVVTSALKTKRIQRCQKCARAEVIKIAYAVRWGKAAFAPIQKRHEHILSLSDMYSGPEIAELLGMSSHQVGAIQRRYHIVPYSVRARGKRRTS